MDGLFRCELVAFAAACVQDARGEAVVDVDWGRQILHLILGRVPPHPAAHATTPTKPRRIARSPVMIRMEDAELERRFGKNFLLYRSRVPAIFPIIRLG